MSYSKVGGHFELKVPLPGYDEERMFYFNPHTTTVATMMDDIQAEDPSITTVKLQGVEGTGESKEYHSFEHDLPLKEILENDFFLTLNAQTFTIVPKSATPCTSAEFDDPTWSPNAVLLKASVWALRHDLQLDSRMKPWSIPMSEFKARCHACGLTPAQGTTLARLWHQTGECMVFDPIPINGTSEDSMTIEETVETPDNAQMYFYPESIIDMFFHETLNVRSPTQDRIHETQTTLSAQRQALEPEYQRMTQLQLELDHRAKRFTDTVCYLTTAGLVGTFGLYSWLSFVHLSWDIMEPVTYFTALGVTIAGTFWFNLTRREYEYQNVYDVLYQRRKQKLYRQRLLDTIVLEKLEHTRTRLHQRYDELDQMKQAPVLLQAVLYQDYLLDQKEQS